jgi:hypothetical protein
MKRTYFVLTFSICVGLASFISQACNPCSKVKSALLKVAAISDEPATIEFRDEIPAAKVHDKAILAVHACIRGTTAISDTANRSAQAALRFANPGGANIDKFEKRVATYNACVADNNVASPSQHRSDALAASKKALFRHLEESLGEDEIQTSKGRTITKMKQTETAFLAFISTFSIAGIARILTADKAKK